MNVACFATADMFGCWNSISQMFLLRALRRKHVKWKCLAGRIDSVILHLFFNEKMTGHD